MINVAAVLIGVIIGILFAVLIAITLWSLTKMSGNHAPKETPIDNDRRFK